MANKFSPITNEWIVVDKSREAWRRVTMLSAAVAVSAVLWIFLGSLLLAVGTRDAAAGRDLAHEFHKSPSLHGSRPVRPPADWPGAFLLSPRTESNNDETLDSALLLRQLINLRLFDDDEENEA
jgi:hypothetical protein